MKNIIKLWKRLLNEKAVLKCGDTQAVSPIYLNALNAIWLAFVSSNYTDF